MNIDLTPIINAVIALIAALVTLRLLPWIKARTTATQQAMLLATTKTLVFAAEQLYQAGEGRQKLAYVKQKLLEKGFAVDLDAIEAMVTQLKLNDKPPDLVDMEL